MKLVCRLQVAPLASVKIRKVYMSPRHWLGIEAQRLLKGVTGGLAPIQFQICDPHKEMRIGIVRIGGNGFLEEFDRVGKFKRQWTGAKDAQTTGRVFCVDADSDGFLYVGIRRADYDTAHTGVLKLDRDWNIVASIGFGKPGDSVFNAVHDIAVGRDGSIYVAETRTKRVVKLRPVK